MSTLADTTATRAAPLPRRAGESASNKVSSLSSYSRFAPLIALCTGLISALSFQPVGWWPLMPLAFAVLAALLAGQRSQWPALLTGWTFGVGQFVLGLNWIATSFTYQAAMPPWLGWVAVVLLSLYLAVYPALATGLAWRIGRSNPVALVLALAGAWAIAEYLRATVFTGFAWNPVGVILIDGGYAKLARWIGTYGLSVAVVLLGGLLWLFSKNWRRARLATILLSVLLISPVFLPQAELRRGAGQPIRVVQPNIGQEEKWRPGLDQEAFAKLGSLSLGGAAHPRLLFWPEVAVPVPFQAFEPGSPQPPVTLPAVNQASAFLRPGDLLVTGAVALAADAQGRVTGEANSVMPIDSAGRILGRYDKAHLVPYGEYLPMRPLLSAIGLSQLAPGIGDARPGPGPRTLALPGFGKAGIQVCYEIIFSGEVVDRRNRPDFIFNPSNDAWFGRWGPPQHLAQARLRAAEEGLPVIRSTPTGISALVDARGALLRSLPWRTAGMIDADLPPPTASPTLFARLGNIIPMVLAAALLIMAVGIASHRRYRRHI
ncbi:apolipoprotein N-acyltransferase [Sphingomonas sp. BN140010]|uniref:Apolipoprotein N-acyltransferase n=1 Tax=Sphingomonas arvum TaxID=2992113 RepID=A0ABT3JHT7_9SPHN|nr:apolipoprotein N-acyltransferase [Sphingomonas sp. BN140010]MCW3798514.1 apolipoprotein N-acyltransferase [Sphingomonas sp. BN140010]